VVKLLAVLATSAVGCFSPDEGSFVHLRVFQSLPYAGSTLEVAAIKTGMKEDDSLEYFEP